VKTQPRDDAFLPATLTIMNQHPSNQSNAPIFVLCCERSGSSLLRYILDTHSAIAAPAELNMGQLCQSVYWTARHTIGTPDSADDPAQRNALVEVRRIVDSLMDQYVVEHGKQRWCEKSPQNIDYIDVLWRVFPDAHYICLHRHAMDVLHSLLEATRYSYMPDQLSGIIRHAGNIVGAMLEIWIRKTKALLAFEAAHPEQCYRIHYEAYVNAPPTVLPPLFNSMGLTWEDGLIESVFTTSHDVGFEDARVALSKRIHTASVGKGKRINPALIPAALRDEMNELLVTLGYEPVGEDWGEERLPPVRNGSTRREDGISEAQLSERFAYMSQLNVESLVKLEG
jgi:hypothetical protein